MKYSTRDRKICYRVVKLHLTEMLPALQRYEDRYLDSTVLLLLNDLLPRKC